MARKLPRREYRSGAAQNRALIFRALFATLLLAVGTACATLPFEQTTTPFEQTTTPFEQTTTPSPTPAPLAVYADAALANVLRDIGTAFTQANPDVKLQWTFAEPDALRVRLAQAPHPAVILSADLQILQNNNAGAPKPVVRDSLAVIIANTNPANVLRIQDLNRDDLRVVVAAENTALGQSTRRLIETFSHDALFGPDFPAVFSGNVVAEVSSGRNVLNLVLENRADAGIVFASEANEQAHRVMTLEMPEGLNVFTQYMSVVGSSGDTAHAQAFVEYLASPQAQTLWHDYGFETK